MLKGEYKHVGKKINHCKTECAAVCRQRDLQPDKLKMDEKQNQLIFVFCSAEHWQCTK